jgi:uncharacterized coiled-coil protein SlyX
MDKLDNIQEKITKIEVTLAEQHQTLKEHTRRSTANEKAVELLKGQTDDVKKIVYTMHGGVKALFAILTIIEIISKFWH